MCPSRNINNAQHNHKKTIANTKMYSGSEHPRLLHPLSKISLGIFTIFTLEYSRVILHRDHNSNPLWFYTETHKPTWFSQANQEPRWFYMETHQPTWFSQANQEPRWFYLDIHQPTWFSQANQEPRWFSLDIHQPITRKDNLKSNLKTNPSCQMLQL